MNSCIFVNGVEICKFKSKNSEINAAPLIFGNVSKDFSANNMKRIGLCGYVFRFSVGFDSIDVTDILDIQKYLMIKNNVK